MKRPERVPLGGLSVDEFLARHWQRRPLLVRGALPPDCAPLDPDALLALAGDDSVESRLVSRAGGRWRLSHGPFGPDDLPPRARRGWTALVQGVDLHSDAAAALRDRFAFVPHARIDDLMISYASDGGGVGPHVDSYDVFLLQVHGRRRWKVSDQRDLALLPGLPLKILARFEPRDEWLLEPGDLLYLPPGWAHDGVAEGECMTASIGFRAPSRLELLRAFLSDAADRVDGPDPRFSDAGAPRPRRPGALPDAMRAFARDAVRGFAPTDREIDDFLGRFLTEPKPTVFFDPPPRPLSEAAFARAAGARGLALDRRSRLAADGARLWINGEREDAPPGGARALFARLADRRALDAADAGRATAEPAGRALLHDWYRAGWLHPAAAATRGGAA